MLTLDALKAFGANTDEGMNRCFNNEAFYLKLVGMGLADENFDRLSRALEAGNAAEAFEAAHALKGSIGNLALTPLFRPISEITEKLRGKTEMVDVGDLYGQVMDALNAARKLAE